jgi:CheY-like chemotaxis protein
MPGDSAPSEGAHLLLVEDDPALREVVVAILTAAGYRAHDAPDGTRALALLAGPHAPPVGAVLLDLHLPDMDGPTFAAAYRALPSPPAPLLVFTAAPPAEAAVAAKGLGAVGVVPKPFDLDDLLAAVGRCLPAPTSPPSEVGPPPAARDAWEPDARRRQLVRLRAEMARVRAATTRVRAAVRLLVAAQATRKLTLAEARRAAALRRQSEALRLEMTLFGKEFERLRTPGPPPARQRSS